MLAFRFWLKWSAGKYLKFTPKSDKENKNTERKSLLTAMCWCSYSTPIIIQCSRINNVNGIIVLSRMTSPDAHYKLEPNTQIASKHYSWHTFSRKEHQLIHSQVFIVIDLSVIDCSTRIWHVNIVAVTYSQVYWNLLWIHFSIFLYDKARTPYRVPSYDWL